MNAMFIMRGRLEERVNTLFTKINDNLTTVKDNKEMIINLNNFINGWHWIKTNIVYRDIPYKKVSSTIEYPDFINKLNKNNNIDINIYELLHLILLGNKKNYLCNFLLYGIIDLKKWVDSNNYIEYFNENLNFEKCINITKDEWEEILMKYTTSAKRNLICSKKNIKLSDEEQIKNNETQKKIFMILLIIFSIPNIFSLFDTKITQCNNLIKKYYILPISINPPPGLENCKAVYYIEYLNSYKSFCELEILKLYNSIVWINKKLQLEESSNI